MCIGIKTKWAYIMKISVIPEKVNIGSLCLSLRPKSETYETLAVWFETYKMGRSV